MAKKKSSRFNPVSFTVYLLILALVFFGMYNWVFVKAYTHIPGVETQTSEKQKDSDADSKKNGQNSKEDADENQDDSISDEQKEKDVQLAQDMGYTVYPENESEHAVVLIDPGHGGFDAGAIAVDDVMEKDITLAVSKYIAEGLQELNPNIEVVMMRDSDEVTWADNEWDDLAYRTAKQDEVKADYNISIHCNSFDDPSVLGYSYYINSDDPVMKELTDKISQNFENINYSTSYGTIEDGALQVVDMSNTHSTLIELGFVTNPDDLKKLEDPAWQKKIGFSIAAAISDYVHNNPDAPEYVSVQEQNNEAVQSQNEAGSTSA